MTVSDLISHLQTMPGHLKLVYKDHFFGGAGSTELQKEDFTLLEKCVSVSNDPMQVTGELE